MNTRGILALSVPVAVLLLTSQVLGCSSPQQPSLCHLSLVEPDAGQDDDEEEDDDDDDEDSGRALRPVRPEEWLQLMVRAQEGRNASQEGRNASQEGRNASQECTGHEISLPEPSQACREAREEALREAREENPDFRPEDETPRQLELTDESVVDQRLNNTRRLVWVITHRFPNGEGMGPIALVERRETDEESTVNVLAIGTLRARTERVRLRLLTIREPLLVVTERLVCPEPEEGEEEDEIEPSQCEVAQQLLIAEGIECRDRLRHQTCQISRELRRELRRDDTTVTCTDDEDPRTCWRARQLLVAEGDTCTDPEQLETCERSVQFLFRTEDRLAQAELFHTSGRCLGRAQMLNTARSQAELTGGWERDFSLASTYEFAGARLLVHQQVTAVDKDPRRPEVPPRPYRVAEADAHWFPFEARFITPNDELWRRMLLEDGSLQVPADAPPSSP